MQIKKLLCGLKNIFLSSPCPNGEVKTFSSIRVFMIYDLTFKLNKSADSYKPSTIYPRKTNDSDYRLSYFYL